MILAHRIFIVATFLILGSGQLDCEPWGVRFNLGDYYMFDEGYQLGITFNTNSSCDGFYLLIDTLKINFTNKFLSYNEKEYTKPFDTYIYKAQISKLNMDKGRILVFQYEIHLDVLNITYTNKVRVISKEATHNYKSLVIGDWGLLDDEHRKIYYDIFPCIQQTLNNDSTIAFILFLGDLGYQLSDNGGDVYIHTIKAISQFTARIPFMISPGNHDTKYSFELFHSTFFSPFYQNTSNYFYSFKIGSHIFMSFNPQQDVYGQDYPKRFDGNLLQMMQEYVEKYKSNTTNLIPFTHYPIYCSDPHEIQCAENPMSMRKYQQFFQQHNVNLYFGAHIHVYQRSFPTSEGKIGSFKNSSINNSYGIYENSDHLTYICQGAAGNNYFVYTTYYSLKQFTANRVINSGFGILEMTNKSNKLIYNHITAKDCSIADHVQVTRNFNENTKSKFKNKTIINVILVLLIIVVSLFIICMLWRYYQRKRKSSDTLINSVGTATSSKDVHSQDKHPEVKVQHFTQEL